MSLAQRQRPVRLLRLLARLADPVGPGLARDGWRRRARGDERGAAAARAAAAGEEQNRKDRQ